VGDYGTQGLSEYMELNEDDVNNPSGSQVVIGEGGKRKP